MRKKNPRSSSDEFTSRLTTKHNHGSACAFKPSVSGCSSRLVRQGCMYLGSHFNNHTLCDPQLFRYCKKLHDTRSSHHDVLDQLFPKKISHQRCLQKNARELGGKTTLVIGRIRFMFGANSFYITMVENLHHLICDTVSHDMLCPNRPRVRRHCHSLRFPQRTELEQDSSRP